MKMSEKICIKCGNKVDSSVNFCPRCKSQSFKNVNELVKPKGNIIHKLFYTYKDSYFVLSKSKLLAIITFIIFAVSFLQLSVSIIFAIIIAFLIYVIGFSLRRIIDDKRPNKKYFKNNNLGVITDLKHLIGYWQDKYTGEFVLSKTKLISWLVFFLFAFSASTIKNATLFSVVLTALIFAAPTFGIGYAIHRFITSRPVKEVVEKTEPLLNKAVKVKTPRETKINKDIPDFSKYEKQLKELCTMYEIKENNARKLIEKRFTPPQLTYDRFIKSVDNSTKMFNMHSEAISNILEMASHESEKIDKEINNRLDILKSLVKKMDELVDELVISLNESDDEGNVDTVFGDMDDLIDSVKDY